MDYTLAPDVLARLHPDLLVRPVRDSPVTTTDTGSVTAKLSTLDRFLPLWIGAAMLLGLVLGRAIPQLDDWLDAVKIGTVSLPIAIGLLS